MTRAKLRGAAAPAPDSTPQPLTVDAGRGLAGHWPPASPSVWVCDLGQPRPTEARHGARAARHRQLPSLKRSREAGDDLSRRCLVSHPPSHEHLPLHIRTCFGGREAAPVRRVGRGARGGLHPAAERLAGPPSSPLEAPLHTLSVLLKLPVDINVDLKFF